MPNTNPIQTFHILWNDATNWNSYFFLHQTHCTITTKQRTDLVLVVNSTAGVLNIALMLHHNQTIKCMLERQNTPFSLCISIFFQEFKHRQPLLKARADPGMGRSGPAPSFWQINHANSAYFGAINFPPILTLSPLFLQILDPALLKVSVSACAPPVEKPCSIDTHVFHSSFSKFSLPTEDKKVLTENYQ